MLKLHAVLACAVGAVYGQVYSYGFVELDDPGYVSDNPFVRAGLTAEGIRWAFSTGHMWHWSPLTWLSHMLDVQLFGLNPGAHHVVNVAFHLANTLLLFALLERMTRAPWSSLTVAALFAIHPLHVESVAWIAERKDVLSTFFFFLTLWAYTAYVEARSWRWYTATLTLFALGLMAKPMLVTLPFVLLLLDLWPLGRLAMPAGAGAAPPRPVRRARQPARAHAIPPATLLWEKVPFLALTAAASVVAYLVHVWSGAINETATLPVGLRVANALVTYVRYLVMALWPVNLAVLYPYDMHLPLWKVIAAALCLGVVSVLVVRNARRHPYALVGWLWYLGTLVPVIGLVQVGSQALADRYTYVPLIGVFVMLAWGGRSLVTRWAVPPPAVAAGVAVAIGVYAVVAWAQVGLWKSGVTLLTHAVEVTRANYIAHNNLGAALAAQGNTNGAIEHFQEALRFNPEYTHARSNLGDALRERYEQAVALNANDAAAHYNLGTALRHSGRLQDAITQYKQTLQLAPDHPSAHTDLGGVLFEMGLLPEAIEQYEQALRRAPNDYTARFNLGSTLARAGRFAEAIEQYQQALRLAPDDAEAWGNLAMAHAGLNQTSAATSAQQKAVQLARSKGQWALAQTLEEWLSSYRKQLAVQ